jgi:hypothetical protein
MRHVVAAALSLLVLVGAARAEEAEDAALRHIDRGVAAFHAGEYTRAHLEFEAAQGLVPARANPYRWLALTEMQLGDCARAVGNIAAFEQRVAAEDPRLAELVRLRVLCVREQAAPPAPPPAPASRRPLVRRPWFWGAVAGASAVIVGGIVVGVARSGDDVARLPPVRCGNAGCAP